MVCILHKHDHLVVNKHTRLPSHTQQLGYNETTLGFKRHND